MQHFKTNQLIISGQAFGVRRGICLTDTKSKPHTHECLEMVYTIAGKGVHFIDEREHPVQRGDLLFIRPDAVHRYTAYETMTYLNFYIDPIALGIPRVTTLQQALHHLYPDLLTEDDGQELYHLPESAFREIEQLAETIHREYHSKKPEYMTVVDGYMRVLLTKIMRLMIPHADSGRGKGISRQLMEYIENNYTKRLTLVDLAELFYYHPVYLGKLFQSAFDMSFKNYLCEKRLDHAERLLLKSDQNIDAIAVASGFSDKKHFYRMFRERNHCTPFEFRKRETVS